MESIWQVIVLIFGFLLLMKGADYFVEGASGIADHFGMPSLIIGLTIVAFGTSAPEAAISISAAVKGSDGIAIGNVLGSNILNILVILGITACITKLKVEESTVKYEIPFVVFITVVLVVLGSGHEKLGKVSGVLLWILFVGFFCYLFWIAKTKKEESMNRKKRPLWLLIVITVAGMGAVVWGSNLAVDSATYLAKLVGISDRIIGLTIVAFGTSLPELVTSVTAARKGEADIAIGNVVGSNIFNILFVLGTSSLITTIPYSREFMVDGIIAIASAVLLWVCVGNDKKLVKKEGILMLVMYAGYFVYLVIR